MHKTTPCEFMLIPTQVYTFTPVHAKNYAAGGANFKHTLTAIFQN